MNHIKLALRQLKLRPGLSFVVIAMLALGIGATTAMFSLYHQVLLRPLPVPEPDRLLNLDARGPRPGGGFADLAINDFAAKFSYPMFRDLSRAQTSFTGIAASVDFQANLSVRDLPTAGRGWLVSGSYFPVLGLQPAVGRLIGPEDEVRFGEPAVAVLSHEYWQSQFGADPSAIGQTLMINGQSLEIIGVAPAGFTGTTLGVRPQVFVPLTLQETMQRGTSGDPENRHYYWLYVFARLAPGVTLERASAEVNGLYAGILNEVEAPAMTPEQLQQLRTRGTLEQFRERQIELSAGGRGRSNLPTAAAQPLTLLLGVTTLVLLIVCVNIANLLLARGASRAGEMATRASLGASRASLVRQLLAESFVLIGIGGIASLAVGAGVVRVITALLPSGTALGLAPELSATAMLFAAGASLATVLVFGLVPALRVSAAKPADAMRTQALRSSGGQGAARFRTVLTTAQIAFSLVLLVLAGLFTKSLLNVGREDPGMDVEAVVSFAITPRLNGYGAERVGALYDRVEEALAAHPGVVGVGSTWLPVLNAGFGQRTFSVEGFDAAPGADTTAASNVIGEGFFDAVGVPLLAGRTFTPSDTAGAPQVAIVNESFARKFNVGRDVGKRLGFGTTDYNVEIVGIVADSKLGALKRSVPPTVYVPRRQWAGQVFSMFYYVRAGVRPEILLAQLPRVVADVDPEVPVTNLQTMTTEVTTNVYVDRLLSAMSAGFAALATVLAGIGLYGVLAYNVTQRTRELGLRLALGAAPGGVRALILKQVGVMALIGAGLGLAGAFGLGRVAETQLYGLSGRDPFVFGAAFAVLALVVLAASWVPAWRASRIAPTQALRYE